MDIVSRKFGSQAVSPITSSPSSGSSVFVPSLHSSDTSFPITAVAIIGILATAFLLVSYYVFVIKCCLNWHRIDLLRRFSLSRNQNNEDPLMAYSPAAMETRGLDQGVIRLIPILKFKKGENREFGERSFCECAVCLNEFQENEKLRVIPNCSHVFHIDCIDIWLQNNANCPLCRTSISLNTTRLFPIDQIIAPSCSPQDPNPYSESLIGGDEDYVVIELSHNHNNNSITDQVLHERPGGESSARAISASPLTRKLEQRVVTKKGRKFNKVSSMGDEFIDIRSKDNQFGVQPIRRSFSMDSSADRQLFLSIQEILQQQQQQQSRQVTEVSPIEGSSNNRARRNFFSFGHGRGSKGSVLPLYLEH